MTRTLVVLSLFCLLGVACSREKGVFVLTDDVGRAIEARLRNGELTRSLPPGAAIESINIQSTSIQVEVLGSDKVRGVLMLRRKSEDEDTGLRHFSMAIKGPLKRESLLPLAKAIDETFHESPWTPIVPVTREGLPTDKELVGEGLSFRQGDEASPLNFYVAIGMAVLQVIFLIVATLFALLSVGKKVATRK